MWGPEEDMDVVILPPFCFLDLSRRPQTYMHAPRRRRMGQPETVESLGLGTRTCAAMRET